jgi:lysozyme
MSVRSRWLRKLNTARLWEKIQRRRYIWHPTAANKHKLNERRAQVREAERVLKRHPANQPIPAHGFDVSNNNGHVDFKAAKRAGQDFVWIKSGEGDWRDPDFQPNVKAATAAGLEVGGYHFLRPKPGRTGAQEAEFFIDRLNAAGLGKGDLRPVLDVEATKLDQAGTRAYVKSFVSAMHAHGFKPAIYTGAWFWDPHVGDESFDLPLWVSGYVPEKDLRLPRAWKSYAVWQYSDKGQVPGVSGRVDVNKTDDLRKVIA